MKKLFAIALVLLGVALLATRWSEPDMRSEVPVIYWVIDPAPARQEQVASFHSWQIRSGHCTEYQLNGTADVEAFRRRNWSPEMRTAIRAGNPQGAALLDGSLSQRDLPATIKVPKAQMRVDAASNDLTKKLIQGVSGVGGDVMDTYEGGMQMRFLASAGMLSDVTKDAKRLGFDPSRTYACLGPSLFYNDRQYSFSRNPAQGLYWVNKNTFEKYNQPIPPTRWTFEEFEAAGKAFVKAANPPGKRQTIFFANGADWKTMRRSLGLSSFNETLTKSALDDPRMAQVYALIYKWTYKDRIIPSAADMQSFSSKGGWGGGTQNLFHRGNFGLMFSGRYALMGLRRLESIPLAVVEPPHGGMPNTILSGGQATVYAGSKHRDLAVLFLAFYASEEYNMQIVRDADGLPPIPEYTNRPEFLKPPKYPNEWGCHEVYAECAKTIAIVHTFSPFVQPEVVNRIEWRAWGEVMNDRATPEKAAREAAEKVDREIQLNIAENKALRERYDEYSALQKKIDSYRAAGLLVPLEWLKNPFHRRLYVVRGWSKATSAESSEGTTP